MRRAFATAFIALAVVSAPLAPAWGQAPAGAPTPLKPATPAQILALKALFPRATPNPAADSTGRADAAYYDCVARRLFVPLSRLLARPSPPTKERVSSLIADQAQASNCEVGDADYVRIKPVEMLDATARFAAGWRPGG